MSLWHIQEILLSDLLLSLVVYVVLNQFIHFSFSGPEIATYPVLWFDLSGAGPGAGLCLSLHLLQKITEKSSGLCTDEIQP